MARTLKDSVVVITGASSGIGRATATRFARKGASVVLAARRVAPLEDLARECERAGGQALVVPTDVTDGKAVEELARRAVEEYGHLDVWVNNAGVSMFARLEESPWEEYQRVIDTNLLGYVRGMRAALPYFREQGYGTIINNASVYGKMGAPYLSAYAASKFGVVGLSESMRQELISDSEIQVCTLLPASIDTPIFQHAANYTGRKVKPLQPVYDADIVAKDIVALAKRPKRERISGGAGRMLRPQRLISPQAFEHLMARQVDRDHFEEWPEGPTSGNVNAPMDEYTEVSGGWESSKAPIANKVLLAAGAAAGIVAARRAIGSDDGGLLRRLPAAAALPVLKKLPLPAKLPLIDATLLTAAYRGDTNLPLPVTVGTNPVLHSIRNLGMFAWFGATLMAATSMDRAASDVSDPSERIAFLDRAWDRWTPVGAAAIATHLVGSALAGWGNKSRGLAQKGMGSQMAVKGGLSAAALGATLYARMLRKQAVEALPAGGAPVIDATTPTPETPPEIEEIQRKLAVAEWAVPALTGAMVALNARMIEQQRVTPTVRGVFARLNPRD